MMDTKDVARKMTMLSDEIGVVVEASRTALTSLLRESVDLFNETKDFPLSEEHAQLSIAIFDAQRVINSNDPHFDPVVDALEELQAKLKACSEFLYKK